MEEIVGNIGQENIFEILKLRDMVFESNMREYFYRIVAGIKMRAFEFIKQNSEKAKAAYIVGLEFGNIVDMVYSLTLPDSFRDKSALDRMSNVFNYYGVDLKDIFDKDIFDYILNK